jgi:hypothetical protein
MVAVALDLHPVFAHAGPCTEQIARLERLAQQSPSPILGPTAPQSLDALLHRQPTPKSIESATERANAQFDATLARAKALDAAGNRTDCMDAVNELKRLFNLE